MFSCTYCLYVPGVRVDVFIKFQFYTNLHVLVQSVQFFVLLWNTQPPWRGTELLTFYFMSGLNLFKLCICFVPFMLAEASFILICWLRYSHSGCTVPKRPKTKIQCTQVARVLPGLAYTMTQESFINGTAVSADYTGFLCLVLSSSPSVMLAVVVMNEIFLRTA